MDNETRLHSIKLNVILPKKNGQVRNLYNEDFDFLVEQAEKLEKIKKLSNAEDTTLADFAKEVLRIIEGREIPTRKPRI